MPRMSHQGAYNSPCKTRWSIMLIMGPINLEVLPCCLTSGNRAVPVDKGEDSHLLSGTTEGRGKAERMYSNHMVFDVLSVLCHGSLIPT